MFLLKSHIASYKIHSQKFRIDHRWNSLENLTNFELFLISLGYSHIDGRHEKEA